MRKLSFNEALQQILKSDSRFDEQVYYFLREALDYTIKMLSKPLEGPGRHVSGGELLEGVRRYALKEYGPMAKTVLNYWGIHRTEDFGNIVFNLVEKGILGKTKEDQKEDFANGYDFDEAFHKPFLPKSADPQKKALPEPTSE